MRLKHFLFLTALVCAFAEIGMALYAMHWGDVIADIAYAENIQPNSELLVVRSLNYALPLGAVCMVLLLYTWRMDAIGGFGLAVALVLHFIGFDLNVRAVKKVYGDHTSLSQVTWWAPVEKNLPEASNDRNS
jgi:hypothetical protein